jgi:hypothetical protein
MNTERIRNLLRALTGDEPLRLDEKELAPYERFLDNPDVRDYLTDCLLDGDGWNYVSGMHLCSLREIRDENLFSAAPGMYVFPEGYLVFATSVGGNALCLQASSGNVLWVDHAACDDHWVNYKDPETGWYETLPRTSENVARIMRPVAQDLEQFLIDLIENGWTDRLDALD